jgi:hypothetical protein
VFFFLLFFFCYFLKKITGILETLIGFNKNSNGELKLKKERKKKER